MFLIQSSIDRHMAVTIGVVETLESAVKIVELLEKQAVNNTRVIQIFAEQVDNAYAYDSKNKLIELCENMNLIDHMYFVTVAKQYISMRKTVVPVTYNFKEVKSLEEYICS